jgi:hypothetical protein
VSSATAYLIEVFDEHGGLVTRYAHKNRYDASKDALMELECDAIDDFTITEISVFLGEDDEWHIER